MPKMVAVPLRCGAESSVTKNWHPLLSGCGCALAMASRPRAEKRSASDVSLAKVVPQMETLPLPVPVMSPPWIINSGTRGGGGGDVGERDRRGRVRG